MRMGNTLDNSITAVSQAVQVTVQPYWGNTLTSCSDTGFNEILTEKLRKGITGRNADSNKISKTNTEVHYEDYVKKSAEIKVPYGYLADEYGLIHYNGVTFLCDEKHNAICLGDMSRAENVLTIPLSGGGCLKVNRDSIDSLSKAIGMFSPEDVKRILTAIATDAKVRAKQKEIEDEVTDTITNLTGSKEEDTEN
jgi:hypothetical protein